MYGENIHSRFCLSEFSIHLGKPRFRSRGGSDNQSSTKGTIDEQKPVTRIDEESRFIRCQNSISAKCTCYDGTRGTRVHRTDRSLEHATCYELFITTDHQANRVNVPDVSRDNSLHDSQSTNVLPLEGNIRVRTLATPEQTKSCEKAETCENIEDTIRIVAEWSFTSAIADATISPTEASPTVHSSSNEPDKSIASTSKWPTSPVSSGKSRRNRLGFGLPFCATTMNLWRKRSSIGNKTVVPVLKWSRKRIGKKELSSAAATTHDNGVKITQIEPSAVQTAREGNKRRAYVNLQMQTPDAIVAEILSKFLLSSEKKKMLISIMLQSESDHGREADKSEAETQTSSDDPTSIRLSTFDSRFDCSNEHSQVAIATTSNTARCLDCYCSQSSDDSISLWEKAVVTE